MSHYAIFHVYAEGVVRCQQVNQDHTHGPHVVSQQTNCWLLFCAVQPTQKLRACKGVMLCGAPLTPAIQHLASARSSLLKSLGCSGITLLLRAVSQLTHLLY